MHHDEAMKRLQSRICALTRTVALLRRLAMEIIGLLLALAALVATAIAVVDRWL